MCGITGIMAFNEIGRMHMIHLAQATNSLKHRGPDYQANYITDQVALGHRRLSVLDPTPDGHQPMTDSSKRYHIVYNGEIYNYAQLRAQLSSQGVEFTSGTDTEVLLYLYKQYGVDCLEKLNGCFAFAIYDSAQDELFLARDRYGINPLMYYHDHDKFVFGSEMRSLLAFNLPRDLNYESLNLYLELNYVPAPHTMLEGVTKLLPGQYLLVKKSEVEAHPYYQLPEVHGSTTNTDSYEDQQKHVADLVEKAVVRRLVADVPIGAFLSGGVDSSIIVAMASRHKENLSTFSIGYSDHPYFDETDYAKLVANRYATNHTVFKLSSRDLYQSLFDLWEHLDEPFADSSALPTYMLSKYVRQSVTVALSGDGADELFGGYNKHVALKNALQKNARNSMISAVGLFTKYLPKSRNGALSNKIRQIHRMAIGLNMGAAERYWFWASLAGRQEALSLLSSSTLVKINRAAVEGRRQQFLKYISEPVDLNKFLSSDLRLVLPNDMLTKVDWMSMAHGLEVRVPFLDHELVKYVIGLPVSAKIHGNLRKRVLRDTFKEDLPPEIYSRSKKGFEVPMLDWMRTEMSGIIENELLSESVLKDQDVFDFGEVQRLKNRLKSRDPGDSAARIWGLLVFQKWWMKYLAG